MRALAAVAVALLLAAGVYFYFNPPDRPDSAAVEESAADPDAWLDALYSRNPREVEAATEKVSSLGPAALPVIQATLRDPEAEAERIKAALKAAGILGQTAAPAIPDVAAVLPEPDVTAEAAVALSYMGREAFPPLRDALSSDDPVVRREALRSIGKLKARAPLDARAVVPLLISAMNDEDPGMRAVAATYLGIIHEGGDEAVRALTTALADEDPEVRRACATALGEFGEAAKPAIPALRKAAGDRDEDVAREAGRALVKLAGGEK
jgi:HEAT repeat protein